MTVKIGAVVEVRRLRASALTVTGRDVLRGGAAPRANHRRVGV